MRRIRIVAVTLALLVVLSSGTAVVGVAAIAGTGTQHAPGSQPAESAAAAGTPVVLQNVSVGELQLANVTLESVVIEELVVQSSQVEEGDEVPGLNETNETDGQPVVFQGVAFEELTLQSVGLSDLEQSSAGPLLNATGAGDGNETAGDGNETANATAGTTGQFDENVTIRNLTIKRMTVADLRISNLTLVQSEAQRSIVDAIGDFVSGLFEGDDEDGQANETNETGAANETGDANETDGILGGDGANETNETDGPIEEALGPESDGGEVIDTLVVETLEADQVTVERMVVRTFRSGGTEAIEETPSENTTEETTPEADNETGLLGDENETGEAEPEVATIESVSVGEVAIDNASADIWVIGETMERNETAAGTANETGEPGAPETNESSVGT